MHGGRKLGWSYMLMYSHVWLCIAMHGGRRLGWSYMLMYSHVWLCIAMHGGRRLVDHICSCTVMDGCA